MLALQTPAYAVEDNPGDQRRGRRSRRSTPVGGEGTFVWAGIGIGRGIESIRAFVDVEPLSPDLAITSEGTQPGVATTGSVGAKPLTADRQVQSLLPEVLNAPALCAALERSDSSHRALNAGVAG